MSAATPLGTELRESHYKAQTGRTELTPAQARRTRHKMNDAARPTARIGRLRRRYDAKDRNQIRKQSNHFVAMLRNQMAWAKFSPKPDSKRQQRITAARRVSK